MSPFERTEECMYASEDDTTEDESSMAYKEAHTHTHTRTHIHCLSLQKSILI